MSLGEAQQYAYFQRRLPGPDPFRPASDSLAGHGKMTVGLEPAAAFCLTGTALPWPSGWCDSELVVGGWGTIYQGPA
jgi:hypothetical protein